tara:strand:+ start:251 stop:736 length:486 start_codon:yes stop_codon:yes gene_type:complete
MVKTEKELLDDYYDIILYLSAKFNNLVPTIPLEDLMQVSFLGAINAIRNYNPEIGPLRNYVFSSSKNYILRFLSKEKFWAEKVKLGLADFAEVQEDKEYALMVRDIIDKASNKLLPIEHKLLLYKSLGSTRKDICDSLHLTKREYYDLFYSAIGKVQLNET